MATRTIDILLNLETKATPGKLDQLEKTLEEMQREAEGVALAMLEAKKNGEDLAALNGRMKTLRGAMAGVREEIDAIKPSIDRAKKAQDEFTAAANQTRERMEKIKQVGSAVVMTGAALVAPFALALNQFRETADEADPRIQKLNELQNEWNASTARLGAVVADYVIPVLDKVLPMFEQAVSWAEENPEAVAAALNIGASLIALGTIVNTVATIVGTVSTVTGLLGSAGLAGGGAAAAGTAAAGAGAAGLSAATITAGVTAAAPAIVGALAVMLGANLGLWIANGLTGQDATWKDVGDNVKKLLVVSGLGWDKIFAWLGMDTSFGEQLMKSTGLAAEYTIDEQYKMQADQIRAEQQMSVQEQNTWIQTISQLFPVVAGINGLITLFTSVRDFLVAIFDNLGMAAEGGYVDRGVYAMGERGTEFVLNNRTTKAAESLIGGRLTQERMLSAITNINLANGVTIMQMRREIRSSESRLRRELIGAF